jgi:hypothetical protein
LFEEKSHSGEIPGDAVFIGNAGLVLLHPFLPRLFASLQIADGDVLKDPGTALQVLHYICTGQRIAVDHELILPKILCGIPTDAFVAVEDPLHEAHCHETERMMQAAIQHWSALRSTSIDGFRESFLQRAGKLAFDEDAGWSLFVEVKTFDILVNHLPWGFGRIRLPWMKAMLQVQWDYQQLS